MTYSARAFPRRIFVSGILTGWSPNWSAPDSCALSSGFRSSTHPCLALLLCPGVATGRMFLMPVRHATVCIAGILSGNRRVCFSRTAVSITRCASVFVSTAHDLASFEAHKIHADWHCFRCAQGRESRSYCLSLTIVILAPAICDPQTRDTSLISGI